MVKRKRGEVEASPTIEPPVVVRGTVTAPVEEPEQLFTVGRWGAYVRWQCRLCPWDTLDGEEAMLEHIQARHGPPPAPAAVIQVYDASGRPVEMGTAAEIRPLVYHK